MKQDVAEKWVKALRSGEYEQGKYVLRTTDGRYCCLGVLCKLEPSLEWNEERRTCDGDYLGLSGKAKELFEIRGSEGFFDPTRVKWPDSIPTESRFRASLAGLNDTGVPFRAIADFIELNYEVL